MNQIRNYFSVLQMISLASAGAFLISGCASLKSVFVLDQTADAPKPISDPFTLYTGTDSGRDSVILRSKKGDRSVEVEIPNGKGELSDFTMPMSPNFKNDNLGSYTPETNYRERRPGISDREITHSFPKSLPEYDGSRQEIESGLGVMASEDNTPAADQSYLAAMDHVKQLYKSARYEAGLLELDDLQRVYPTDPKLYQMRGTLLDRLGRPDLALKAWNQSLRFDPGNQSLRKFIEKKQAKRGLASGGGQP